MDDGHSGLNYADKTGLTRCGIGEPHGCVGIELKAAGIDILRGNKFSQVFLFDVIFRCRHDLRDFQGS